MVFQIVFSLLFILPIVGSMGVLFKAIKAEINKKNIKGRKVSVGKVVGYSILSATGIYIALFLIWLIWIPNIDLPFTIQIVSYCLAAPYLLGVVEVGLALQRSTEFGVSASKITNTVSRDISND